MPIRKNIPKRVMSIPKHAERVFKGVIYDVYQWEQEQFDGTTKTFESLKRPDTIRIIALKDDKFVIGEQEQPGVSLFYDFPGGMHDEKGESELDAAKRELREETGLVCKTWKLLNVVQPSSKTDMFSYTFLAYDVTDEVPQQLDSGEKINVLFMSLSELKTKMEEDTFRSPKITIIETAKSVEDLKNLPEYKN